MANKKYTNADVKSLKRNEIIELLKENNIEFDENENQSLYSLRSLLVEKAEVADETLSDEPTPMEETAEEVVEEAAEAAEAAEEEVVEEKVVETAEPEAAKPVENPIADKEVVHASFQNELSKRMATFGKAKQSVFAIELARRQGKVTGRISFAEELKLRKNKAKR